MIRNPFRKLTPAEMLTKQLADAQANLVHYRAIREEADYSIKMLDARVARIKRDLKAISEEKETTDE